MNIEIWSVGKVHDKNILSAISEYEKRLKHYVKLEWKIIPPSKAKSKKEIQKDETNTVTQMMSTKDSYILLDERGKGWDNQKWVAEIEDHQNYNPNKLIIIIGGAYGFEDNFVKTQKNKVNISSLILPHQLVRLIMIEQLYRSYSIIHNTGYHHT